MGIIDWPNSEDLGQARCIVCKENVPISDMTVCLLQDGSRQQFACSVHLGQGESGRFLRSWVEMTLAGNAPAISMLSEGDGQGIWQMSSSSTASSYRA